MLPLADGMRGSRPPQSAGSVPGASLLRAGQRLREDSFGFGLCPSLEQVITSSRTSSAERSLPRGGLWLPQSPQPGGGRVAWILSLLRAHARGAAPGLGLGVCTATLDPPVRLLVWRYPCSGLVLVPGPGGSLDSPRRRFVAFRPAGVGSVPHGGTDGSRAARGQLELAPWAQTAGRPRGRRRGPATWETCHSPATSLFSPFASRLPPCRQAAAPLGPVSCCQPRTVASREASCETSVLAACLRCLLVFFPQRTCF